jgi:hypothetical protein
MHENAETERVTDITPYVNPSAISSMDYPIDFEAIKKVSYRVVRNTAVGPIGNIPECVVENLIGRRLNLAGRSPSG